MGAATVLSGKGRGHLTQRENFFALLRRQGYETMPAGFNWCPSLEERYGDRLRAMKESGKYPFDPMVNLKGVPIRTHPVEAYLPYYGTLKPGAAVDALGVAREPGSEAAMHMKRLRHPLDRATTLAELEAYPWPQADPNAEALDCARAQADAIRQADGVVCGNMQQTIWERAWALRGMENLMMDMMEESELATFILDWVTGLAQQQAEFYVRAGAEVLYLGDDVGMQRSPMMSMALYDTWLKPRLARVIGAARALKPDLLIIYHSCGFVEPFIDTWIDLSIDVLNPIQPECMDFERLHAQYGDRLSFHGGIGTQSTMPFGTPKEVREAVERILRIAGPKGGLLVAPTHMLEPEVPWANIEAFIEACAQWKP